LTINVQPTVKKPNKLLQIIPIIIIIASVTGALYFSGFFNEEAGAINIPDTLTPTRNIEGTWKTTFSTQFTIATDYGDFQTLADVGTENRTMTWIITGTGQENIVNVEVSFTYSDRQLISGSGYTPDVSPMDLTGVINGTQLTLTKADQGPIKQAGSVGVFTFTTTQMQGTWHDHWEGVWEQNVYTPTNGLKLLKQ
jgi:hypothetical protein